jgi:hypothetical protein
MRDTQILGTLRREPGSRRARCRGISIHEEIRELTMGRYALLWMLGVPIPVLLLIYFFGGLN